MAKVNAQAFAYGQKNEYFVLATFGGKYVVLHYKNGKITDIHKVPGAMWLLTSYSDAEKGLTLVASSRQGDTYIFQPESKKRGQKIKIPTAGTGTGRGYVNDLVTIYNKPHLTGYDSQCYQWNGEAWVDLTFNLRQFGNASIRDITNWNSKPAVLSTQNIYVLKENAWEEIMTSKKNSTGLFFDNSTQTFYMLNKFGAGEKHIGHLSIISKEKTEEVTFEPDTYEAWDIEMYKNEMYISDLTTVYRVEKNTLVDTRVPSKEPANQNHTLVVAHDLLHFLSAEGLCVYDGKKWELMPLPESF